jgi:hypothetical protein
MLKSDGADTNLHLDLVPKGTGKVRVGDGSGGGANIVTTSSTDTLTNKTLTTPKISSTGSINKSNIDSLYVNGIDKTSETQVSNIFKAKDLHHVIVTLTSPVTEEIIFNYKQVGSEKALYQYITIYEYEMDVNIIQNHYNLYMEKSKYQSSGSILTVSENNVSLYNTDWVVLQNS